MFNQCFFPKIRNSVRAFGLIVALAMPACATVPKLTNKKLPKNVVSQQASLAIKKQRSIDAQAVRNQIERLKKSLAKGTLSESDWKLHDELLEIYIRLKSRSPNKIVISARSKIIIPFETYCLNSDKASPSEKEIYHWQKGSPGISYYKDLLKLRQENQIDQHTLQTLLWNLQNETRWEDYPSELKAILQRVDPQASIKLPSNIKDQAKGMIADAVLGLPGASDALGAYNMVKGKYYEYDDFRRSVENIVSKHDLANYDNLTQVPGTELYTQSESDGFSSQDMTFYNPTDRSQEVNLDEYYLAPERKDVQRIGINPKEPVDASLLSDLEKVLYESMARLGIGFTPVLGDAADLYEMIYGKDFLTGKALSFDERLASAVGVALGSGSAYRQAKRWINAPTEYLPKFESELAKAANKTLGQPSYEGAKKIIDNSSVDAYKLGKGLDYNGTQELSKFLRDNEIERKFRVQTVQSFEPGSIKRRVIEKDEAVYRWHNKNEDVRQFGRYVSPEKIEDKAMARSKLALPSENHMTHLDSFSLKKGTAVFEGRVAPYNGQSGGGRQILIPGDLQKALKLESRIN